MILSRFSNNQVKYLSTWKMSLSDFLLLNKNENHHNNDYKTLKNTNLVTIPNSGVSFYFWFWNLSNNQSFPGSGIKLADLEKIPKMNTTKHSYCDLHLSWTIVIFE